MIGIGSMVGAGVFSAIGPAAAAAGSWLVLGLALAAVVAYCNAVASAQLAAQYPLSGGTYVYGRERLGPWWGFAAGWCFVTGKTASCAAMALTFGAYVAPGSALAQRLLGIGAVVLLTAVTLRGVERTAHLTRALVAVSVAVLVLIVALLLTSGETDASRLTVGEPDAYGVLQAAGLLFFAFAGYARIATLAEEVREPERTIPRAIVAALAAVLAALPRGRRVGAPRRGARRPRREHRAVAHCGGARRRDVGEAGRHGRRGRREPRRAARAPRGHRADDARDEPRATTCPAGSRRSIPTAPSPTSRSSRSRPWWSRSWRRSTCAG